MQSAPPATPGVCRFCGLHSEPYGHASISECVTALEGETNLLRKHVRQREPKAPTPIGTYRDRQAGVMPRH